MTGYSERGYLEQKRGDAQNGELPDDFLESFTAARIVDWFPMRAAVKHTLVGLHSHI